MNFILFLHKSIKNLQISQKNRLNFWWYVYRNTMSILKLIKSKRFVNRWNSFLENCSLMEKKWDHQTQKNEKLYMQTFNLMIMYKLNHILAFLQIRGYQTFVVLKVVCVKNVILCLSRLSHKMLHNQNKKGLMKPTVCTVSILEVVYKLFSATCSR